MEDLIDFVIGMAGIALGVFLFILFMMFFAYQFGDKPACENYHKLTGEQIETHFFGASCLVKHDGKWITYNAAVNNNGSLKVEEK